MTKFLEECMKKLAAYQSAFGKFVNVSAPKVTTQGAKGVARLGKRVISGAPTHNVTKPLTAQRLRAPTGRKKGLSVSGVQ